MAVVQDDGRQRGISAFELRELAIGRDVLEIDIDGD